ncbi:MAG: hypothetical protein IPP71_00880 [Bacteroidetes bacterium]|nr:hypothetical protein [Bacteroidota bacterium]
MSKKGATTQSAFGGVSVLIICLFPILYLTFFNFTYDPTNVPRFLVLSVFLLGAVWLLKDFAEKSIAVKFVNLALIGFYAWSLLSLTWSLSGSESIFQTQKHFIFVLSIFLFSSLIKKTAISQSIYPDH